MEKQGNPGLWIGAAGLAAVIVMLIVLPVGKPGAVPVVVAPDRKNAADVPAKADVPAPKSTPTSTTAEPLAPSAPSALSGLPPQKTTTPDPDDPLPPAKPLIPADRENTIRILDNIQFALRDYRSALGGNPVGTNAEITSSLLGNNLKQVKIPLPDGTTVNGTGEMCDPWGTPMFFHQQSGTKMEIRSAGPDRTMHTADDVMM